jgi:hypothetical protein
MSGGRAQLIGPRPRCPTGKGRGPTKRPRPANGAPRIGLTAVSGWLTRSQYCLIVELTDSFRRPRRQARTQPGICTARRGPCGEWGRTGAGAQLTAVWENWLSQCGYRTCPPPLWPWRRGGVRAGVRGARSVGAARGGVALRRHDGRPGPSPLPWAKGWSRCGSSGPGTVGGAYPGAAAIGEREHRASDGAAVRPPGPPAPPAACVLRTTPASSGTAAGGWSLANWRGKCSEWAPFLNETPRAPRRFPSW